MEKNVQREQAREFYLQTAMTHEQIAHLLNVNRKTVGLWIQQGKWREMKEAALHAPGIILEDLYAQLSNLNNAINSREPQYRYPTLEESTIQRRLLMSIKSFEQQSAGNYIQTYTELLAEMAHDDAELTKEVCRYADDIIIRKYNRDKRSPKQSMFLTDDVDELDDLDLEEASTPLPANETQCDISDSQITQQPQLSQPDTVLPTSHNNNPQKLDNTMQPLDPNLLNKEPVKLPNGVTWLGYNWVYDPAIGRKRDIKMGEIHEFTQMGYGWIFKW